MKYALALACAALITAGPAAAQTAPASTQGPVDDAIQKTLSSNYALGCTAAFDPTDANLNAAFASLAPDFVNIDPSGHQATRDEVVGLAMQQMKMLHAKSCDHTIESLAASGDGTVVAVTTLHLEGSLQSGAGAHDLDLTDRAQDTWKNVGGKWEETQSKDLHLLVKVDGNVVQDQSS